MSRAQRWIVTAAALVVLGAAGLWVLGVVQQANSPEEKCKRVLADIERDRGRPMTASAWLAAYDDCVERERTGQTLVSPNASPEELCGAVIQELRKDGDLSRPGVNVQELYDGCLARERARR